MARYDLVVVGLGSAGFIATEIASELGLRVAAVESARPGGDCLWTGCVPSKALVAAAKAAYVMRTADRFGIPSVEPDVDLRAVWGRIRSLQEEIASTDDSPERIRQLGVELIHGRARLIGPTTVDVDGRVLDTRFVLLATGSRPAVPPVEGLAEAGYLTSESLWLVDSPPRSVAVIGGGPMGVELAQGLNRLGVATTLLQRGPRLLPRDEPVLTAIVADKLRGEGVEVRLDADVRSVELDGASKVVTARVGGDEHRWSVEEIIVATGRRPNVDGLGLSELGVEVNERGVPTDDALRTSLESVYAVGDVVGRNRFTHAAAYEASIALRNMFFPWRSKANALIPWTTFCDPPLASAGLTAETAVERHGAKAVRVWRQDMAESDYARVDAETDGAMLLVTVKGRLVGAHVLAPAAGELIPELALAIGKRMRLRDLAFQVHVYPTIALSAQRLAGFSMYELVRRLGRLARRR